MNTKILSKNVSKFSTLGLSLAIVTLLAVSQIQMSAQPATGNTQQPILTALDQDGDGNISPDEVANSPESLKRLDINGDGMLSPQETRLPSSGGRPRAGFMAQIMENPRVQPLVNLIDRNGDQTISADEMARSSDAIKSLDLDGDWNLSATETAMRRGDAGGGGGPGGGGGGPGGGRRNRTGPERVGPGGGSNTRSIQNRGPFGATLFDDRVPPGTNDRALDGYVFYQETNTNSDRTVGNTTWLLNSLLQPVHRWDNAHHTPEGLGPYLLENGLVVRPFSRGNWLDMKKKDFYVGSFTSLEIIDWEGNQLWEFDYAVPRRHVMHHDLEPMPNGNLLVIVNDFKTREEAESLGFAPLNDREIAFERIIEIEPNLEDGSTRIVWEWSLADHTVQDVDPKLPNYGDPKDHAGKIDINYSVKTSRSMPGSIFHFNSISYNEDRDQILVSNFGNNEVFIIDHSTTTQEAKTGKGGKSGMGGDLLYRWGNPHAYGLGKFEERSLFKQHDAAWIPNGIPAKGDISIFNNGQGRRPAHTEYIELKLPANGHGFERAEYKPFGPPEPQYVYKADPPESFNVPFMSGARRLSNGNIFGGSGLVNGVFEVTAEGEEVLGAKLGGRSSFYRVYKFAKDYPAFKGRDLQPLETGWTVPGLEWISQTTASSTRNQNDLSAAGSGQRGNRQLSRSRREAGGPAGNGNRPGGARSGTQILERFDQNGDGKVDQSELPEQFAERILDRFDKNDDGVIERSELNQGQPN